MLFVINNLPPPEKIGGGQSNYTDTKIQIYF